MSVVPFPALPPPPAINPGMEVDIINGPYRGQTGMVLLTDGTGTARVSIGGTHCMVAQRHLRQPGTRQ